MRHVRLGGTGLRVSQLCLGTMTFGLQCDEPTSVAILDRAAAGGITFLDASDVYPIGGNLGTVGRAKARDVGCSDYFAYQIARALGRSEHLGLARFDCVQPRYNLLFRQVERELFPLCAEEGLGVIPYNPIAGGLLSGKHRREAGPMPGTRFTHPTAGARYRDRYWRERELETVEALRPLATEAGMSMTQMAVAWVLENPIVTAPIVGASRPEQLDDALAAVDKGLDEGLKPHQDWLTREYRWGDDIR